MFVCFFRFLESRTSKGLGDNGLDDTIDDIVDRAFTLSKGLMYGVWRS